MKKERVVYLISTVYANIDNIFKKIPDKCEQIEYLICCQVRNGRELKSIENDKLQYLNRSDVNLSIMAELGLSKSRNFLLEQFFSQYVESFAVITDDDVEFIPLNYQNIDGIFKKLKSDVVTGRVLTPEGNYFSPYKSNYFKHNLRTSNSISSIEIILSSSLSSTKTRFDERFGLGAEFKMGEEAIYIGDLIKQGFNVSFYPLNTFYHPVESTGSKVDNDWFRAKGAFYARKYGKLIGGLLLLRRLSNMVLAKKANLKESMISFISLCKLS
ncbi:hypothetical protein VHTUMSATKI_28870 [Vibrio harveyi]|uniref:hypothetical protein n=1 Tax=Vibrio harveyi TaxID=669 RepID=UPI0036F31BE4